MNRVQKVLEGANIKLAAVASNVLGVVAFRLFDIFQGPRLLELMCISLLESAAWTDDEIQAASSLLGPTRSAIKP